MTDLLWIAAFVVSNVWRILPYFLLSIAFSVLISSLKLDSAIRSAFTKRTGRSVALATAVGAFSPFCSCTVIPVVKSLLLSGVPLAPVMAFWVASPLMDVEIFALSGATLGWPLAITRMVATLLVSLGAGYLTLALVNAGFFQNGFLRTDRKAKAAAGCCTSAPAPISLSTVVNAAQQTVAACCAPTLVAAPARAAASSVRIPLTVASAQPAAACCAPAPISLRVSAPAASGCGCGAAFETTARPAERWWSSIVTSLRAIDPRTFATDVARLSWSLGRFLVLAFVLESLIIRYVPRAAIMSVLGTNSVFAVPLAAVLGLPLYFTNLSALPILSGLLGQGMQPGAVIAFLISGPLTTFPAMTAVWGVADRRIFALFVSIGVGGAILMGLLTNLIFLYL
jgi:hypothetical protein